jgi:prolyl-tRNA editing enzyme YbaK/EbsC (Cys-tRNA(Pro) deacylase)
VEGHQGEVIKSLVFMADSQAVLVVVMGADRVEARKVADTLGIARRRVRLASPREALVASGYSVGTVPPFGHPEPLRTLLDSAVLRYPLVHGGGGHPDIEIAVAVPDLLHFSKVSSTPPLFLSPQPPAPPLNP